MFHYYTSLVPEYYPMLSAQQTLKLLDKTELLQQPHQVSLCQELSQSQSWPPPDYQGAEYQRFPPHRPSPPVLKDIHYHCPDTHLHYQAPSSLCSVHTSP